MGLQTEEMLIQDLGIKFIDSLEKFCKKNGARLATIRQVLFNG